MKADTSGKKAETNEQIYYDALKRITSYLSPDQLRRSAEKQYGLDYVEALEMAYENVIGEAKTAVRGKRRPQKSGQSTTRLKGENDGNPANHGETTAGQERR